MASSEINNNELDPSEEQDIDKGINRRRLLKVLTAGGGLLLRRPYCPANGRRPSFK